MRSQDLLILALVPLTLFAQTTAAPAKPDFTGHWQLLKTKSDFGGFPAPDTLERNIETQDDLLVVHTTQTGKDKTDTADASYFINGYTSKNFISGLNAYSYCFWKDSTLVIHTNIQDPKGDSIVIEDEWTLSQDKQTLTITGHITTKKGIADTRLVFTKS